MEGFQLFVVVIFAVVVDQISGSAPDKFTVAFNTTQGRFNVAIVREWSPLGVDRFYELVQEKYYNDNAFFRVIRSPSPFVAQWGISGDPTTSAKWENKQIGNDPVVKSNIRGFISYAAEMKDNKACCRTTQLFINYANNARLDVMGFTPFGQIDAAGMAIADKFYSGYGESPNQGSIYSRGNAYLKESFPRLDYLISVEVVQD